MTTNNDSSTQVPTPNTKIIFASATAFVRKYTVGKKQIKFTSSHRGTRISLNQGYIIIDRRWYGQK